MTTHELARLLLSGENLPVVHHYYHHEDFEDEGYNWTSEIKILKDKGVILLSTGDLVDCK